MRSAILVRRSGSFDRRVADNPARVIEREFTRYEHRFMPCHEPHNLGGSRELPRLRDALSRVDAHAAILLSEIY
jgi:hypothetical protein